MFNLSNQAIKSKECKWRLLVEFMLQKHESNVGTFMAEEMKQNQHYGVDHVTPVTIPKQRYTVRLLLEY